MAIMSDTATDVAKPDAVRSYITLKILKKTLLKLWQKPINLYYNNENKSITCYHIFIWKRKLELVFTAADVSCAVTPCNMICLKIVPDFV